MESFIGTTESGASRRRFLSVVATGIFAGASGLVGVRAQQSRPETIRLDGDTEGWQGRTPKSIAGETNPRLSLKAGKQYRITWKNVDGQPHNIALLDANGGTIQRTETISKQGATQTIEFTARGAMAEYLCEVHPTSMRGALEVGGSNGTAANETTENGTAGSSGSAGEPYIPKGASVRLEPLVEDGPDSPLDFEVPPGNNDRRFIVDRAGQVYVHDTNGLNERPFIDVSDRLADIKGEMGLLGMAFHSDFQQNRKFYLRYSAPPREGTPEDFSHTEVLSEFTASEDGSVGNPDSERTLLEVPSPQSIHNSGALAFGPDSYLYMGMGDGGGGSDNSLGHVEDWYEPLDGGNGQDVTENLLGSILRIDVDNREDNKPYAIPDDNPLVGKPGLDEQFAWGFRNPWRIGFSNGKLFAADVGQNVYEEVDIVSKGNNYGWNIREGTHCFEPNVMEPVNLSDSESCPMKLPPDVRSGERLVSPIVEYPHSYRGTGVGSAVIGGYVSENDTIPSIRGKYVFGDFRKNIDIETPSGSLFAATPTEKGQWSLEELTVENRESGRVGAFVLAIGRDNAGDLYVLTTTDHDPGEGTGAVHRIAPAQSAQSIPGATTKTGSGNSNTTAAPPETGEGAQNESGGANTPTQSMDGGGTETSTGSSGGSGPGFGFIAALSAVSLGAFRLLGRSEDR